MSSSLAAERTPLGSRAVLVLTVFSFIGLGAFASSIVYLILLSAFKKAIEKDINHLEWVWRLLIGLAIIPAGATLYARLTMRETKPYEKCMWRRNLPIPANLYLQMLPSRRALRPRTSKHEV